MNPNLLPAIRPVIVALDPAAALLAETLRNETTTHILMPPNPLPDPFGFIRFLDQFNFRADLFITTSTCWVEPAFSLCSIYGEIHCTIPEPTIPRYREIRKMPDFIGMHIWGETPHSFHIARDHTKKYLPCPPVLLRDARNGAEITHPWQTCAAHSIDTWESACAALEQTASMESEPKGQ